jgi:amidohydrolase
MTNREAHDRICQAIDAMAPELQRISKAMYDHPELGHAEFESSKLLQEFLKGKGLAVETPVGGMATAFRASVAGKAAGPTVAIMGEFDALPGVGHGCGHNIIGTAGAAAVAALKAIGTELNGQVVMLGAPAEEGGVENAGGKVLMVREGLFHKVDAAIMIHPSSANMVDNSSNAREAIEISFTGKTAHAAGAPHEGINALEAVLLMFNGINSLRQHVKTDVRIHGIITKGGEAPNIVPDFAQARVYVRAADRGYMTQVVARVKACAEGAALATGAKVTFRNFANTYENMRTNKVVAEAMAANYREVGLEVDTAPHAGAGSTDMGNVSHVVPSVHGYLAICERGIPGHSREFAEATVANSGREGLIATAKILACTAYDLLAQPELIKRAWDEFDR